jgi:hypothetical protein
MACGDGVSSQQSCQKENRTAPDALSAPAVDGATLASRDSPVAPSRNRSITAPAIALLLLPHHFSTCSALLQLALPAFGISYASFLGHFAGKTHPQTRPGVRVGPALAHTKPASAFTSPARCWRKIEHVTYRTPKQTSRYIYFHQHTPWCSPDFDLTTSSPQSTAVPVHSGAGLRSRPSSPQAAIRGFVALPLAHHIIAAAGHIPCLARQYSQAPT